MKKKCFILAVLFTFFFNGHFLLSQTIARSELVFLTSEWKGERFTDGRPKIADDLLMRARAIGIDDAWTVLKNLGYTNQFESGWKMVNEGVLFIPAHLAELVISTSEFVVLKDKFGFEMVRSNQYSTGQIDSQWTEDIKQSFLKWLQQHPELGKMSKAQLDEIMSKRTW